METGVLRRSRLIVKTSALPAIELINIEKRYYVYEHRTTTLQEFFMRSLRREAIHVRQAHYQLSNVNLCVAAGESVALIGHNGSGKSTMLRLMAGIYPPTNGTVIRRGRIVAVIELGSTFQPTLTGRENIRLYAAALGVSKREANEQMEDILDFSGVSEFADVPMKYYSSGMKSRLAFSIAISAQPDVLLLDEVLAVGDAEFALQCAERLADFQARGGTIVFASHSLTAVRDLCQRALWLDGGVVQAIGPVDAVTRLYEAQVRASWDAGLPVPNGGE
jgi:ABC-type polysaccharide/polyol phosphate transport system ATPase subunit